jgi:hypothetical protein
VLTILLAGTGLQWLQKIQCLEVSGTQDTKWIDCASFWAYGRVEEQQHFARGELITGESEGACYQHKHACQGEIFSDPAYGLSPVLISPSNDDKTAEQLEWNRDMSLVWMSVEHAFAIILNHWPYLRAFWKHWEYTSGVGRNYCVGVLLSNSINCLHPNQTAQRYNCQPPMVEEYVL